MPFRLHISQALANIFSSKLRSFLAVLGILVGTGSVVALVSGGELATKEALDQFKALGTDLMAVSFLEESREGKKADTEDFELKHVKLLLDSVKAIKTIAPYTTLYSPTSYDGLRLSATILGVTEALRDTIKIQVAKGRFISHLDNYGYFCVLGSNIYKQIMDLLGKKDLIGTQIQIGKFFYTIVGVADFWPENSFFNADINSSIMVPLQTTQLINKYSKIYNVVMKLHTDINLNKIQSDITTFMDQHVPHLKLFFRSASQFIQRMKNQHQIFTLMLGFIGGIALLVGGIGVMNIMLVSVTERKREIGIRMAVGAKRKDILILFLIEAIVLALLGGVMGIFVGIVASYVIAIISKWSFAIFILPPTLGFIVSVATGIFFGFYPAYRASKLDPIQTLRYE